MLLTGIGHAIKMGTGNFPLGGGSMKTMSPICFALVFFCVMAGPHNAVRAGDEVAQVPAAEPVPPDPPAPLVKLKVRVPACLGPGQELEYRILVENCSPAAAHHVIVRDLLPANVRFIRASPEPHKTEPELQWNLGTLPAWGCQQITLILCPTAPGDVTNCLRVQFEHGVCLCTRVAGTAPPFPGKIVPLEPIPKEPIPKEPKRSRVPRNRRRRSRASSRSRSRGRPKTSS